MRSLIAIPFISGPDHSRLAIESVLNQQYHDLLLIDNGSDRETKAVLNHYHSRENVHIISNPENIYVNPAWNQAMEYFVSREQYDVLILMNSDLILHEKWHIELDRFFNGENKEHIPVPIISDRPHEYVYSDEFQEIHGGISGVFIVLHRKAVECVYPIPEQIKVWFGDNWIYDLARGNGFKTGILKGLITTHWHGGSKSVIRTPNVSAIIEQDKIEWDKTVRPLMQEKLKYKP